MALPCAGPWFSVEGKNEERGTPGVSYLRKLYVTVDGITVTMMKSRRTLVSMAHTAPITCAPRYTFTPFFSLLYPFSLYFILSLFLLLWFTDTSAEAWILFHSQAFLKTHSSFFSHSFSAIITEICLVRTNSILFGLYTDVIKCV